MYEFDFGGEYHSRPGPGAPAAEWTAYLYLRANSDGVQTEWWYHRQGCKLWFLGERNTSTNEIRAAFWPEEVKSHRPSEAP